MAWMALIALQVQGNDHAPKENTGSQTYERFCMSCHGKNLEGATGPKLIDSLWLHGGSSQEILKSINSGFPVKGMPAFESMLSAEQKNSLCEYILSKQQGLREIKYSLSTNDGSNGSSEIINLLALPDTKLLKDNQIVYEAKLLVHKDGEYTIEIYDNGKSIIQIGKDQINRDKAKKIKVRLAQGSHDFKLTYICEGKKDSLGLYWTGPQVSEWLSAPVKGARGPDPIFIKVDDRAKVYRCNIKGQQSARSLSMGFPGGINCVYDIEHHNFTHSWKGPYIDVAPTREGRGMGFALPGTEAIEKIDLPVLPQGKFKGYFISGAEVTLHIGESWATLFAKTDQSGLGVRISQHAPMSRAMPEPAIEAREYSNEPKPTLLPEGYSVQTIPLPPGRALQMAGLAISPRGEVFVCTREGEVWKRGTHGQWHLFAEGFNEPCGLRWIEDKNELWIAQKPELTALKDEDGDQRADQFRTITSDWGLSGNYHEYHFGPEIGPDGSIYGTLNLSHRPQMASSMKNITCMSAVKAMKRGTAYRISPDGTYETFGWGLRSPAGTGLTPDGELIFLDNQGDWMPTSYLSIIERGSFHGHPAGMDIHPDYIGKNLDAIPASEWAQKRVPPAIYIPHEELANSPGNAIYDSTGGKFGPFSGQIFVGDQTQSNVFRCQLQKVKGVWQGCAIDFIRSLRCGVIRTEFAPDGSLWTCATSRGFHSVGDLPFALQRIQWDGATVPFCIKSIIHEKGGFRFYFTAPLKSAPEIADLNISHWTYNFWEKYGSPKVDTTKVIPEKAVLSDDRMSLFIAIPELVKRRCYGFFMPSLTDAKGRKLSSDHGWYTLNETED
jgi:glucose/arabinose dehydrogenase/cytochrome c5